MTVYTIKTEKENWVPITAQVQQTVEHSGIKNGICVVYCPHTTAGLTINENADPDVVHDLVHTLNKVYPDRPEYRHMEGNSAAHTKASVMGASVTVPVHEGHLAMGTWQGIYFCEFDGPRTRKFYVQVV